MGTTTKTVKVVVAGDSSGAQSALDKLASKSSSAASSIKSHLSGLFGTLSNSGMFSGVIAEVSTLGQAFDGLAQKGASISEKLAGVGVAVAGVGAALTMASQGDQQAQQQLAQAFVDTGNNIEAYKGQIDKTVSTMAHYGDTAKEVDTSLQTLVQATKNPTEALKLESEAADLAAAKHESLQTATTQLAQIIAGKGTKVLQQLGIQNTVVAVSATTVTSATKAEEAAHAKLITAQQKLTALVQAYPNAADATSKAHAKYEAAVAAVSAASEKYKMATQHATDVTKQFQNPLQAAQGNLAAVAKATSGQAAAASNTWTGKLKELRAELDNHIAELGQKYGPAITAAGAAMTVAASAARATGAVMDMFRSSTEAASVATETLTASQTASGVAADGMAAGETAADAAGAPLILTIGLIVLAVAAVVAIIYELIKHWREVFGEIKQIIADVVGWIKGHWELLVAIFTGPIGAVAMLIYHFRDQIIGFFQDIVNFVGSIPGSIENFFEGIPTTIINFFQNIGSEFAQVGEAIVNGLVQGIESMGFAIWDAIKSHIPGSGVIGGALNAIGLAEGGIVTKPTLAMVGEAGYPEAVIPLKNGATVRGLNDAVQDLSGLPKGPSGAKVGGGQNFTVYQEVYLPTGTPEDFAQETTWQLSRLVS